MKTMLIAAALLAGIAGPALAQTAVNGAATDQNGAVVYPPVGSGSAARNTQNTPVNSLAPRTSEYDNGAAAPVGRQGVPSEVIEQQDFGRPTAK